MNTLFVYFKHNKDGNVQKYFYYLESIYYGTLPTHSMSLSFAPILKMKRSKQQFCYVQNLSNIKWVSEFIIFFNLS